MEDAEKITEPDKKAEAITAAKKIYDGSVEWCVMCEAVPDFHFHMTALAYLCVGTSAEISRLIGKSRDYFNEKVLSWGEALTDSQWEKLTMRAFQELIESNIGEDYKFQETNNRGAPDTKK